MKKNWPILVIAMVVLAAFFPVFLGKIPLNTRNLVAFFSPWHYEKFEGFPTGVPGKPGMLDQLRIYYPYMALTQRTYRSGEIPLWNPHNFAGNPHMAEWQSGVFYPLHILLPFLPLPIYWSFYQMTGFFLAGLFTYWFLKNLKISRLGSLLGGMTYMLSSFMFTWNMEVVTTSHSILWLPLVLLAVDKLLKRESGRAIRSFSGGWWLLGLFSIVFSILSGYWQTTFYVMGVAGLYAIYRSLAEKKRTRIFVSENVRLKIPKSLIMILAWFPLAGMLTAFHLLPTWELYGRSSRSMINSLPRIQEVLVSYLLPLRHLATLVAPDFFGHPTTRNYFANIGGTYYEHVLFAGTIPLFLALLSLTTRWRGKRKSKDVIFFTLLSLIAGSLSFNAPWSRLVYQLHLPVLATGIANRILFIPAFGMSYLAAMGLGEIEKKKNMTIIKRLIGAGLTVFLILAGVVYLTKSSLGVIDGLKRTNLYLISLRNLVIPLGVYLAGGGLILVAVMKKEWRKYALGLLVAASVVQNLYQFHKFTAFSEVQFNYPVHSTIAWLQENAGFDRFIGYNGQFLNNNFATMFGLYSVEGYDSLNDHRRSILIHSAVEGRLNPDIPRSADTLLGRDLNNPRTIKLMQLFGIRYLVDHPEWIDAGPTAEKKKLAGEKQKLVFEDGDFRIWEFLDAYPRAFMAGGFELVGDGQELIDRLFADDFNSREKILLTSNIEEGFNFRPDETAEAEIIKYGPTRLTIRTSSRADQLLFLSDTWYPGWQARLEDGRRLPVLVADYALRAVPVPAGEHELTMWYFPDSFRNGLYIAGLTLAGVLVIMTVGRFRKQ